MTLARIEALLREEPGDLFATLFGPRASGRERPGSDWDVAVLLAPDLDARSRFDWRRRGARAGVRPPSRSVRIPPEAARGRG